jgi:hypothetical protein
MHCFKQIVLMLFWHKDMEVWEPPTSAIASL